MFSTVTYLSSGQAGRDVPRGDAQVSRQGGLQIGLLRKDRSGQGVGEMLRHVRQGLLQARSSRLRGQRCLGLRVQISSQE